MQFSRDRFTQILCTVLLEPGMQAFFGKYVLCQTFSLGVIQMHVLVSLGVVYPFRNSV